MNLQKVNRKGLCHSRLNFDSAFSIFTTTSRYHYEAQAGMHRIYSSRLKPKPNKMFLLFSAFILVETCKTTSVLTADLHLQSELFNPVFD